jgi:hypothetical protein
MEPYYNRSSAQNSVKLESADFVIVRKNGQIQVNFPGNPRVAMDPTDPAHRCPTRLKTPCELGSKQLLASVLINLADGIRLRGAAGTGLPRVNPNPVRSGPM